MSVEKELRFGAYSKCLLLFQQADGPPNSLRNGGIERSTVYRCTSTLRQSKRAGQAGCLSSLKPVRKLQRLSGTLT